MVCRRMLEPYTEPETKEPECIHPDSDNCKWKNICDHTQCYFDPIKSETKDNNNMEIMEEYHLKLHPLTGEPMPNEKVKEIADRIAKNVYDNVTKQLKDNMEEKELNLSKLLKGCEREEFYSLMHGKVRFMTISADGFIMFDSPESISVYDNGKYDLNAEVIIYPSRALYEKYPLDAYSAWMEWKSERTPKRWRAERNKEYWYIDGALDVCCGKEQHMKTDEKRHIRGNYFRTKEEAKQAAEAVRECLMKIHENNIGK